MKALKNDVHKKPGTMARHFKKLLLAAIAMLLFAPGMKAQDQLYSQFTNVPLFYNPAYTGLERGMRAKFVYRRQWVKMPHDFKAMNFNMDVAARGIPGSGGMGIQFDSHNEGGGLIKRNSFGVNLAVRIPIMANVVSQLGISATFVQKYIDWTRLIFSDQLDEQYGNIYPTDFAPPSSNKVNYPDFGVGGIFRFRQEASQDYVVYGTFGLAVQHLFEPNESFISAESNLPVKFVGSMDFQIQLDESSRNFERGFKYNPAFMYMNQGGMDSWSVGINVYKHPLYVGAWYRTSEMQFMDNNVIVVLLGINTNFGDNMRMKLIYSYDIILSELAKATGGSHEISLIFEMDDMRLFGNNVRRGSRQDKMGREIECSPF